MFNPVLPGFAQILLGFRRGNVGTSAIHASPLMEDYSKQSRFVIPNNHWTRSELWTVTGHDPLDRALGHLHLRKKTLYD